MKMTSSFINYWDNLKLSFKKQSCTSFLMLKTEVVKDGAIRMSLSFEGGRALVDPVVNI